MEFRIGYLDVTITSMNVTFHNCMEVTDVDMVYLVLAAESVRDFILENLSPKNAYVFETDKAVARDTILLTYDKRLQAADQEIIKAIVYREFHKIPFMRETEKVAYDYFRYQLDSILTDSGIAWMILEKAKEIPLVSDEIYKTSLCLILNEAGMTSTAEWLGERPHLDGKPCRAQLNLCQVLEKYSIRPDVQVLLRRLISMHAVE